MGQIHEFVAEAGCRSWALLEAGALQAKYLRRLSEEMFILHANPNNFTQVEYSKDQQSLMD